MTALPVNPKHFISKHHTSQQHTNEHLTGEHRTSEHHAGEHHADEHPVGEPLTSENASHTSENAPKWDWVLETLQAMDDNSGAKWSELVDSATKHSPAPPSLPLNNHNGLWEKPVPSHFVAERSEKHAAGVSGQSSSRKSPETTRRQKRKAKVHETALFPEAPNEGDEKKNDETQKLNYDEQRVEEERRCQAFQARLAVGISRV